MTAPAPAPAAPADAREKGPSLPWTLVRLKLRLMANRAGRSTSGAVQLIVAILAALVSGVLIGLGLVAAGLARDPLVNRTVLVVGATALTLVWTVFPLLTFGSDETLDPARLVLFPLRRTPLMRGLLLSSFVGPAPAVAVVAAVGVVVGYSGRGGWVVVIPAVVLVLLLSAATARTLSTLLAAGLSSRRGRDASIIVGSLLALGFQGVRFVRFSAVDAGMLDHINDILRWLPPGMLGQAVHDARTGSLGLALLELVPAAVAIPLLLRSWARALERSMTVVNDGATPKQRRGGNASLPLIPRRLPFLASTPWGAVTARELRYVVREPRRKVVVANSVVIGLGLPLWAVLSSAGGLGERAVLLATVAGYMVMLSSSNQFGLDGAALWLDVVAGDTTRATIVGKNVAAALEVLPIVTLIGVVVAAITGGWLYLPAAVLLALAGLGAGLATANVVSVRYPVRLPANTSPFSGRGGGQGCATGFILFVGWAIQNVLLAPVAIGSALAAAAGPGWLTLAVPLCLAYGAALWWGGVTLATRWADAHRPELLAAVDPGRGN